MQNKDLSLQQLLTDERFIQWVKFPDPVLDHEWQQWTGQHYARAALVAEARKILLSLDFPVEKMNPQQKRALRARIQQQIAADKRVRQFTFPADSSAKVFRSWLRYAAVLAGLLLLAAYWLFFGRTTHYQTQYGEVASYRLPDSSVVTLNANSEIRFRFAASREVWLQGEGYFQVKRMEKEHQAMPFIVHTNQLDVEVLGTEFNVNTRRGATSVTLKTGKVLLNAPQAAITHLRMQPGERAVLDAQNQLALQQVNPALYTSWKDNKLMFDHISLGEIAAVIEDTYGYQVVIRNQQLRQRKFTGTLPTDNLNLFLSMLEEIFRAHIEKKGDKIVME